MVLQKFYTVHGVSKNPNQMIKDCHKIKAFRKGQKISISDINFCSSIENKNTSVKNT